MPTHWSSAMGGAEYQVKCLLDKIIDKEKYCIYYIARDIKEDNIDIGYRKIKLQNFKRIEKYGYFMDGPILMKKLKEINPDIIYQRIACAYTGYAAYYAKTTNFKCKMMWHISSDSDVKKHDANYLRKPQKFIEDNIVKYGIKNAGVIIAQTEYQKKILFKNYNMRANLLVKNFHPFPNEKKIHKNKNDVNIIWISNFKRIKNPEIFISIANDITKKVENVKFIMIGRQASWDQEWQNMLEKKIRIIPRLEYIGEKRIDEVNEYLSKSHLLVNTSSVEGFPNTFIQAWMRAVPVISLSCDPDNILKSQKIGIYAGSYKNLMNAIIYLIRRRDILEEMGKRARLYALREHSMKNADKIINYIEKIL